MRACQAWFLIDWFWVGDLHCYIPHDKDSKNNKRFQMSFVECLLSVELIKTWYFLFTEMQSVSFTLFSCMFSGYPRLPLKVTCRCLKNFTFVHMSNFLHFFIPCWCFFQENVDAFMIIFLFNIIVEAWRGCWSHEGLWRTRFSCTNWFIPWQYKIHGYPRWTRGCYSRKEGILIYFYVLVPSILLVIEIV